MSFDLYFYKRNDNPITEDDVATYLKHNLTFNNSKSTKQWDYENPETGVYFLIDWNDPDDEAENFDGFTDLNFSFSLNFFRPQFFGFETFPIIEKFVNDLDLFVLDPQDFGETVVLEKIAPGFLKEEWTSHNDHVTREHYDELKLRFMPVDKSMYLWQFQFHREKIQNDLNEDIFVAGIFVMQKQTGGQLYTMCVWPDHIPVILPKVDYVIIRKKHTKFFKNVEESGLVPYHEVMRKLGDSFKDFVHDVPHLKVLTPKRANRVWQKFNRLKIECAATDFGALIAKDNFVNTRPE